MWGGERKVELLRMKWKWSWGKLILTHFWLQSLVFCFFEGFGKRFVVVLFFIFFIRADEEEDDDGTITEEYSGSCSFISLLYLPFSLSPPQFLFVGATVQRLVALAKEEVFFKKNSLFFLFCSLFSFSFFFSLTLFFKMWLLIGGTVGLMISSASMLAIPHYAGLDRERKERVKRKEERKERESFISCLIRKYSPIL